MAEQTGALLIRGDGWLAETRFANALLRGGTRVLWVQRAIDSTLSAGDLLVPLDPAFDAGLADAVDPAGINALAAKLDIELQPVAAGSVVATPLRALRIGLYGGGGAPFNHAGVFGEAGFQLRFLNDVQVLAGELDTVDVLVMPGGGTRAMYGQLDPLGIEGARRLTQWVRDGGMYIGSCAGAYDCAIAPPNFTATCPPKGELQLVNARIWNGGEESGGLGGEIEGLDSPGVGVIRLRNTRPEHPVMFGLPDEFEIVHYNGPVFDLLEAPEVVAASLTDGLAAFAGRETRFTPGEQLIGDVVLTGPTLLERSATAGKHSAIAGELGAGRAAAFGSHPEFGFNLAMTEWGAPARMLVNAALWQASHRAHPAAEWSYRESPGAVSSPRGASLAIVEALTAQLQTDVAALRELPIDPLPRWLHSDYAMSVFGLSSVEIWRQSLDDIAEISGDIAARAGGLRDAIAGLGNDCSAREAVALLDHFILDERPAAWRQDGGYQGIATLLRTAHEMCAAAIAQWDVELGPPAGPYDYLFENPYHLVAGSYLAAVGCVAGAVQLMRVLESEVALAG